ncbi:MAG: phage tail sheath family protein [Anaerolineaceae bacterium]|nr:phage tail sheath family protein [Anaerolineaceae bacterium]
MPQYLSPGIYVEEKASGIQPIAGVSTSVAGFIGIVSDGVVMPPQPGKFTTKDDGTVEPVLYTVAPAGEPQLITSWQQFVAHFGEIQNDTTKKNSVLAYSVYGFFNNGGTRCYVCRLNTANLTVAGVKSALQTFSGIDEISLVLAPGATDAAIQNAVVDHCTNMKDRFAILDGQQNPASYTADLVKGSVAPSNFAALYFPWLQIYDTVSESNISIPPSGYIAGIYARVDGERGVHKAPANEQIRGIVGLDYRLSKADQDGLNPKGINVIREMNGSIRVWGARTLEGSDSSEWKYISVRRLLLFIAESIDEGTQWVVFEPNNRNLWAKIRLNVTAFLSNIWRDGALFGSTPEEAFFVHCDDSNNPPELRNLGQVVIDIGVAVTKPAEFVIFRISQWDGPSNN